MTMPVTDTDANVRSPLSVVIAAHQAAGVIATCLNALATQVNGPPLEVIVADSSSDGTDAIVRRQFPDVRLLHTDESLPLQQLRGQGIAAAHGRIIAILDPYSVPAPDWASNVLAAHERRPEPVIGGLVGLYDSAQCNLRQWAIYFNEYGLFMPPGRAGPVNILPGSNLSYKRSLLFDGDRPRYPVFWKTFVNWESESHGDALWLETSIRVDLNKQIPFVEFLKTRHLHGRCFAGMRVKSETIATRVLRAITTPLLPLVLMARWTSGIWPKRSRRVRFLLTVPLQLLLFAAWSWGELCGYLYGPGDACHRLYF